MTDHVYRILLLRHGQTVANIERRYAGKTDLPLDDQGVAQIRRFKKDGLYPDISGYHLYETGLLRTKQTLSIIWPGRASDILLDLREMDFGVFEMHNYEELKNDPDYQRWIEDQTGDVVCPTGESQNQFKQRILKGLQKLTEKRQNAVIVTHGGVIACLMQWLFPSENKHFYRWQPKNGCGYLICFSGNRAISYTNIDDQ